jgi:hypothetical protein
MPDHSRSHGTAQLQTDFDEEAKSFIEAKVLH